MDQTPEIHRLIASLIRIGIVHSRDLADPAAPRYAIASGALLTSPLPCIASRAGKTSSSSPLDIGEQVVLLCPSGDPAAAIVLGSLPSNDFPAPTTSETLHCTQYSDGAVISYDTASGSLTVSGIKTAEVTASGAVVLRAATVTIDAQQTTIKGACTVQGPFAYMAGMSGADGGNGQGTAISGQFSHKDGKLSSNGVVLDSHDHGNVQNGGGRTDGPR
ncbi:phage baseplate assembly protein V [Silvimonas sp.]|uniref:phage baseplate assembly protein V n=1 Tax=Silvimonas sp. TaxID=2650811 RepID=UPI00283AE792|nr:phage baseplate assembly protein V [Silvimonas sp.]MDR3429020.1 phage baseplate assembly protein V [Silvimonas sp.]